MSKEYREKNEIEMDKKTTDEMRDWSKRPGRKDKNGNIVYLTEQHHRDQCDVNKIIEKYDKTGLISHINKVEAKFGDMTGMDFKEAMDKVTGMTSMFNDLPSNIRKRFGNSPEQLLQFMSDSKNRDEAIKLGLIDARWTPETDGIGEHIKTDAERKEKEDTE